MSVFEIALQRKDEDAWPVFVRHQPGAGALELSRRGRLGLDPGDLAPLLPSQKEYGLHLGEALFRDDVRDAFVRAVAKARSADEPLRVLLSVEAGDLRPLHWEQLCAPLDRGWDYLLLNQGTPFSLIVPAGPILSILCILPVLLVPASTLQAAHPETRPSPSAPARECIEFVLGVRNRSRSWRIPDSMVQ